MAKDKKIEVVCSWCGKPKKVKPYTYHRNNRFFCDDNTTGNSECRRNWESVFSTGEGNPNYKAKVSVKCEYCGKTKEIKPSRYHKSETKRFYCNIECQARWMELNVNSEDSNFWKGGVKSRDIPLYDTYASQISFAIECRRGMENRDYLEIKCSLCGKWHIPSLKHLKSILSSFNRIGTHLNLYCSDECKEACPVYRQRIFPKGFKVNDYRNEILDPDLRLLVFNRDSYQCQKCGVSEDLHVHHIEGVAQNPMLANDIENCITVCHSCHAEIHSRPGCTYFDYQREACEDNSKDAINILTV